jgi:NADH-quinone oxidoreductase subunit I
MKPLVNYFRLVVEGAWSLICGLGVTAKYAVWPYSTVQYPFKKLTMYPRLKGPVVFVKDPQTGKNRCIACKACERICPAACIKVEGEKGADGKRRPTAYTMDNGLCCLCSLCIEVCPTDALEHSRRFEWVATAPDALKRDFLEIEAHPKEPEEVRYRML